ncbi:hypothetical protein AO1008_03970 [Aspergillus oryzae 100-8]|uniref:NACHT domain-containing protein n=1 Tax=Aspergillus oryzae (strain 3.042) TaxID=1160506 RepID=I7ZRH4_ASPO3|nr:hypothetical protein Ao3042_09561 [Aspergillus oryzae 3.042]KDE77968.1 hypothetical protein AO1008_03970 [Aspergillus oryzae 100-8]|eukprot:EIT74457.1 hypothetical protein Ao3042_09561 [Aspergillus oryzae 3.042]
MILDPVPSLRLCENILHLLDLSCRLLTPGRDLDLLGEDINLNEVYDTLLRLSGGLASRLTMYWSTNLLSIDGSLSYGDLELQNLAPCCQGLCAQLLVAARELGLHDGSSRLFRSFHEGLQAVWNKRQIEALEEGLLACRWQAMRVLTIILRDGQSRVSHEIRSLKNQNRQIDMSPTRWLRCVLYTISDIKHKVNQFYFGDEIPGVICGHNREQIHYMARRMAHAVQKASKVAFVQRFLKTLHFRKIRDRHARIARAHEKTFIWVFGTRTNETAHASHSPTILNWLRGQNDSIYWVAGKAASGKSTFMKYLLAHPQTQENLKLWAGSAKLVIASHFFWGAGTDMQKSKQGLLQSLLYSMFSHSPDLFSMACQRRWKATMLDEQDDSIWSVEDLLEAFKTLTSQTEFPTKFCLFIDGLDECTEDHSELIKLLNSLVQSNVKICLSSRRWKVFEDAYGEPEDRRLYLEQNNREDIHSYVQSELEQHPAWGPIVEINPRTSGIVAEITDRSQGVFLWAVLVVRYFHEWLTHGDTMFFLEQKLRNFPVDLELLFKSMLESLHPMYTSYVRRIFKLALTAPEPLPVMAYASLERGLKDESNVHPQGKKPLSYRDQLLRIGQLDRQLQHMGKGLLEVYRQHNEQDALRYRVDFLHRTVRDFFSRNEILQGTDGVSQSMV